MQALYQIKWPFVFFTEQDWELTEIDELLCRAIDYFECTQSEYTTEPLPLVGLKSVMMPIYFQQSTVRIVRMPHELDHEPGMPGRFFPIHEMYDEKVHGTPREYAEWFQTSRNSYSNSLIHEALFLDDLRYWLKMNQVFYIDHEATLKMFEQTYKRPTRKLQRTIVNKPLCAVW